MKTDRPDKTTGHLNPWLQRLVGLLVFVASTSLLVCISLLYREYYVSLATFHVEGLAVMILIAFGMAGTAAPFFAESLTANSDDKPKNCLEAAKLYVSVTMISFVALSLVFLVLWILGWVIELTKLWLGLLKLRLLGTV